MGLIRTVVTSVLSLVWIIGAAQAETRKPSQEEVKALTIRAAELVAARGLDEATGAFIAEGEFRYGEVYISVIDTQGNWVVFPPRPANKGKTILNFVDEDGRELGRDILSVGLRGEGWTEYRWKNPATNSIQPKATYVKRVAGQDLIVYSGIYK